MGPAFPGADEDDGVTVVPARRVSDLLQALPPILGPQRVTWLADRARLRSAPPPDRPHQQALDVPLLAQPDLDGRLVRLTAFDRGAPAHCCP